jgi:hypothetical protein
MAYVITAKILLCVLAPLANLLPYYDGLGLPAKTQRYAKRFALYWPHFQVIGVFKSEAGTTINMVVALSS